MESQKITSEERAQLIVAYDILRNSRITQVRPTVPLLMRPIFFMLIGDIMRVDCNGSEYEWDRDVPGGIAIEELLRIGALMLKDAPVGPVFHAPVAVLTLGSGKWRGLVLKVAEKTIFVYSKWGLFVYNKNTGDPRPHLSVTEEDVRMYYLDNLDQIRSYLQSQNRWDGTMPQGIPAVGEDLVRWCEENNVVAVDLAEEVKPTGSR